MKKGRKIILGGLFIILVVLFLTVPSENDYYKWIENKHDIKESDRLYYYTQGDVELFDSSLYQKSFGIFTTKRQNFEYVENGRLLGNSTTKRAFRELNPDEGFTIRVLGIGKTFFPMEKESFLWKIVMYK